MSTSLATANLEVVRSGYAAFQRGDMQAVFGLLDPDVEFYQSSDVPF